MPDENNTITQEVDLLERFELLVQEGNTYILTTVDEYNDQFEIIIQEENNLSIIAEEINNIVELNIVEEVVKYLEIEELGSSEVSGRLPITQKNRNSDGYITSIVRGGVTTYTFARNSLNQITGVTVT